MVPHKAKAGVDFHEVPVTDAGKVTRIALPGRADPVTVILGNSDARLVPVTDEPYALPRRFTATVLDLGTAAIDVTCSVQSRTLRLNEITLKAFTEDDEDVIPIDLNLGRLPIRALVHNVAALFARRQLHGTDAAPAYDVIGLSKKGRAA